MLDMGDPRVLKSFVLGEVGIDGGVLGSQHAREGWKKFISAPEYLVELQAFDARIASDSYVIGAVVFGLGMNDDWFGFDVDGSAELMTWLGAQGTLPKLIHQDGNGGGAMPVGIGFQTWRTLEQDVIGDFVESEVWHDLADTNRETSTVWTTHAQLRWFRQFNTMDFRTNGGRYRIYNGGNPRWLN